MENSKSEWYIGIDLLKAIAIFGVVIIHAVQATLIQYLLSIGFHQFWGSIARASVPIFSCVAGHYY